MTDADPVVELNPEVCGRWRVSDAGELSERIERHRVLELPGEANGRGVLDLGCGAGDLAVACSRRGAHVFGIDDAALPMIEGLEEAA